MERPTKPGVRARAALAGTALLAVLALSGCGPEYIVLHPAGPVSKQIYDLIILSVVLVLVVVVPVMVLLVYIVWRYRDVPGNTAPYQPKWSHNRTLEIVWWGIPIVIVGILGAYTAKTTFALTRPPEADVKPVTIEVTSLDWKWLFQYPDQGIATVNYCEIPTGVPVQFILTSDAPMNSFWVPQLAGQEYTMPGMAMRLWVQADQPGTYYGHGANFTGKGFAQMSFNVVAKSDSDFQKWVQSVKQTAPALTEAGYQALKQPSVVGELSYSSFPAGLFDKVVWEDGGRYMPGMMSANGLSAQSAGANTTSGMSGMAGMAGMGESTDSNQSSGQ
ncbi:MAG: cytochrome c oxidase subunit II [Thermoflavifilum sp.]|nr:cytochrome c oxidase subunit II [Thermoflavifilum sp.]MCL6513466.1 cytochrome c oxidase subunit II [Alicyclobacillus sp.]